MLTTSRKPSNRDQESLSPKASERILNSIGLDKLWQSHKNPTDDSEHSTKYKQSATVGARARNAFGDHARRLIISSFFISSSP